MVATPTAGAADLRELLKKCGPRVEKFGCPASMKILAYILFAESFVRAAPCGIKHVESVFSKVVSGTMSLSKHAERWIKACRALKERPGLVLELLKAARSAAGRELLCVDLPLVLRVVEPLFLAKVPLEIQVEAIAHMRTSELQRSWGWDGSVSDIRLGLLRDYFIAGVVTELADSMAFDLAPI
ncbi:hypothetical protein WJX72_003425 [[Myrmecia] bisecta]|uniref:Uncharacterized protein n=1 Tax=[Myrmecia] bisecta TaxID=41462 RepID=A0AAW1P0V9_9CHLO